MFVPERAHLPQPTELQKKNQLRGEVVFRGIRKVLSNPTDYSPYSIYCHLPFCRKRCTFCDLYTFTFSEVGPGRVDRYVETLIKETSLWGAQMALNERSVTTLHFGGGTPSALPQEALAKLVAGFRENLGLNKMTEIALETTSSAMTSSYRQFLRDQGINRIHMGIQSLKDAIRRRMAREESASEVMERIEEILGEGFILSLDLIFGLPGQTLSDFQQDIERLIDTSVHGVQLYELQIPANHGGGVNRMKGFRRDRRLNHDMYIRGSDLLTQAGFAQNYFVHFSRPQDKNLYNTFPMRGENCLAFGAIANGIVGDWVFSNHELEAYQESIDRGQSGISRGFRLNESEKIIRRFESACLSTHIPKPTMAVMEGAGRAGFIALRREWMEQGLMTAGEQEYRVTAKGCWYLGNMFDRLRSLPLNTRVRQMNAGKLKSPSETQQNDLTLTEELFVIPDDGDYLIYAPFERSALKVNGAGLQQLRQIRQGQVTQAFRESRFYRQLCENRILVYPDDVRKREFSEKQGEFDPKGLTLFLTTGCSMSCVYCYANGGSKVNTMSWETSQSAVDWIIGHTVKKGRRSLSLMFHGGGEVTTVHPLLKRIVAYAKLKAFENSIDIAFHAGLNGIMNSSTVAWVAENLNGATLSIDGLPEVHDRQRPLKNGRGSYAKVTQSLRQFDKLGFNYSIRATVTRDSLPHLPESVEHLATHFASKVIQVEPLFPSGRALLNDLDAPTPEAFVAAFRSAKQRATKHGVQLKYSGARSHALTNRFCAVGNDSLSVTPEGLLTSCYEVSEKDDPRSENFFFGDLDAETGKLNLDLQKVEKIRSMTVENKPYCEKCFCKWHCAGDCAAKLATSKDPWDPSRSPRCYINRELTKDQIKKTMQSG
ncbi:MAG: radical SAM protein [Gammaproteobacteria bacterium]|nr:radical SAM protein [Gammaproteobacteria bacterium]